MLHGLNVEYWHTQAWGAEPSETFSSLFCVQMRQLQKNEPDTSASACRHDQLGNESCSARKLELVSGAFLV